MILREYWSMEEYGISNSDPDWSREEITRFWEPGKKLIRAVRRYQALGGRGVRAKYWALNHRFWSVITQSEIHLTCEIGGGLRLPHPTGIIVHPEARIGVNCMLFHQVTLAGPVVVGGHVDIGAGAKIVGPLRLGDDVRVGANAVVTADVADGLTVAGIPARVIGETPLEAPSE
ncbi:serine acetyltransferase [Roseobacteraceae bacterium S113]